MGLFDRNKKELPPLFSEAELEELPATDFNAVVSFLEGLSDEDYAKTCKVVEIYRKANQETAGVLGTPNEPTTFINPPEPQPEDRVTNTAYADRLANDMLDDQDDLDFLTDDDHDSPASKKQSETAKKATKRVKVNH